MELRNVAVVAVALLVVLSGCSAFGGTQTDAPSNETGDEQNESLSDDESNESTGESGSDNEADSDNEDNTANADWSPPQPPNRPMERKDVEEDLPEMIKSVTFVDKVPAEDGEGYSNFNLEVVANTSMEKIDPPHHGTVRGEPYFFVKINQGPDNQKIVERTAQVPMKEDGTFHIDVRPAGIEEFGETTLNVEVFLIDKDSEWDDVYDANAATIEFNPGSGGGTDGGDTNESESNAIELDSDETNESEPIEG
ncbi:hypothetical protein [Natrinema gelatinilyticum]|uniref:hypothetical protein n=1 Tax=Natrinema gelatinilyticum TaxID=2961571 RepID=UPI0020C2818E|nr:hypothetical protein [Natrinema gelatinilyticum]